MFGKVLTFHGRIRTVYGDFRGQILNLDKLLRLVLKMVQYVYGKNRKFPNG